MLEQVAPGLKHSAGDGLGQGRGEGSGPNRFSGGGRSTNLKHGDLQSRSGVTRTLASGCKHQGSRHSRPRERAPGSCLRQARGQAPRAKSVGNPCLALRDVRIRPEHQSKYHEISCQFGSSSMSLIFQCAGHVLLPSILQRFCYVRGQGMDSRHSPLASLAHEVGNDGLHRIPRLIAEGWRPAMALESDSPPYRHPTDSS
jgi:hypothetical protein